MKTSLRRCIGVLGALVCLYCLTAVAFADDLATDAALLRQVLFPQTSADTVAAQENVCANLLRFGSFRNKVQAYSASPEEIARHGRRNFVIQDLPDGRQLTDIPQHGQDLFVDLKINFNNSLQDAQATCENFGRNNPVHGWSYIPRQGLFTPDTELFLVAWHGAGGGISHAGSVLPLIRSLINPKVSNYKKTMAKISAQGPGNFKPAAISAEAFDFPFCGNHDDTFAPHQANLAETLAHLATYFKVRRQEAIKKLGHDIPIVVLARSAAAGILLALEEAYPGIIDGNILVGPTAPGTQQYDLGYDDSFGHLLEEIHQGVSKPNYYSILWTSQLYREMTPWAAQDDPFQKTNTLVLVGENDLETPGIMLFQGKRIPTKVRAWLLRKAAELSHLYYDIVPRGRHDVFMRYRGQEHYDNITPLANVQLFLKAQVEDFKAKNLNITAGEP